MAAYALSALFSAGLSARIEGDQLLVQPAERLTDALRNFIREHKPELMAALRGEAANGPQIHRRWQVTDPSGRTWSVTQTPPATAGEMAQSWPAGSVLEPLPDQPTQPDSQPLPAAVEARIRAWLDSIGEADLPTIREVLELCAQDASVLERYLSLAADAPGEYPSRDVNCCGTCLNYQRTTYPHLGHCQAGEPEPAGGLWDSDLRSCPAWEANP